MKRHGLCNARIYRIRKYMLKRCNNKNNKNYKDYGGRGISVCPEWADSQNGAIAFYDWAIQHGYSDDLTIDRIDVDGDYTPDNCRWIPMKYQGRNKREQKNKTGFAGVHMERSGRFGATITENGVLYRIGTYDTAEEASAAYQTAKHKRDKFLSRYEGEAICNG